MITIGQTPIKPFRNFLNHALFHPTDAIEDPWGKKILDTMATDGGIDTIRIYNMLEDIVYMGNDGKLQYDFRLNDLRLDYLEENGFGVLIAYGAMPDCISGKKNLGSSVSKNKTRYKGKLFNTSPPSDYRLWEEICYQYTVHIVERYGIETVSKWHLQCFNEPDSPLFFMADVPNDAEGTKLRLDEYCKLYAAFARAVKRVSEKLCVGGPALADNLDFLHGFLTYVKENDLPLDYIAVHCYGTHPHLMNSGKKPVKVSNILEAHDRYTAVINHCGFGNTPLIYDEWGAASHGFFNVEECPDMIFRETEKFSAFFVRMLSEFTERNANIAKMMICLSGQHEMTTDFSGFRNFFTLHFIKKPIYNANILSSWLGDTLVGCKSDDENVKLLATVKNGGYAILGTYCTDDLNEHLPDKAATLQFEENLTGKTVRLYLIDKTHLSPYRLAEDGELADHEIARLRREGELRPVCEYVLTERTVTLDLSANAVFFCEILAKEVNT